MIQCECICVAPTVNQKYYRPNHSLAAKTKKKKDWVVLKDWHRMRIQFHAIYSLKVNN